MRIITILFIMLTAFNAHAELKLSPTMSTTFQSGVRVIGLDGEHVLYCINGKIFDNSGFWGAYKDRNLSCKQDYKFIKIIKGGVNLDQ